MAGAVPPPQRRLDGAAIDTLAALREVLQQLCGDSKAGPVSSPPRAPRSRAAVPHGGVSRDLRKPQDARGTRSGGDQLGPLSAPPAPLKVLTTEVHPNHKTQLLRTEGSRVLFVISADCCPPPRPANTQDPLPGHCHLSKRKYFLSSSHFLLARLFFN